MMPPNVMWYYDRMRDVVVVMTTTTTYTLLHMGHLNNLAEVPPILAPTDLPEFLYPLPAMLGHELMPEVKPIPEYIPLPKLQPMSPDLPPLEPIVPKVPIIDISSLDSPTPTVEPHQASDILELDPSKETFYSS